MKRIGLVIGILGMAALGFAAAMPFQAQGQQDAVSAAQEAMDKWMAYSTPGPEQEWLAGRVGTWDVDVTQFHQGTDPVKNTLVAQYEMMMGGRYLLENTIGMSAGRHFEGAGIVGYDNARKLLVSSWVDNTGTGIATGVGTRSQNGMRVDWQVTTTDPMTGGPILMRMVEKYADNNRIVTTIFTPDPKGGETMIMELIYTRVGQQQ